VFDESGVTVGVARVRAGLVPDLDDTDSQIVAKELGALRGGRGIAYVDVLADRQALQCRASGRVEPDERRLTPACRPVWRVEHGRPVASFVDQYGRPLSDPDVFQKFPWSTSLSPRPS
jgi:hypothetical protein